MVVPELDHSPMLFAFETHTLPEPSMARPVGSLRPPPVYPADGEMAVPELESLAMPLSHAAHTLPEASMAMAKGPGKKMPPPV